MASDTKKACCDVSRQVKDAMERGDWAEVARILSECSRRDSDSVMTQLVRRDQWDAVKQVTRCVGDEERTWELDGVLLKNSIMVAVAEGNWRGFGDMPHERFLHSTIDWILQQACTRAKETEIVQYVLPHCEDDQLDSALQQLVTHGLWFAAGQILSRPVSDERVRWVIQKACQRAEELILRAYVIPFCPTSTLDLLLTEVVSRDMWQAAGRVLMRGVSDAKHCWALKEACCRADDWQVKHVLLPFCTKSHCYSVLTDFVEERHWGKVKKLLNCAKNVSLTVTGDGPRVSSHCLHLVSSKDWIGILILLGINTTGCEEIHRSRERNIDVNKIIVHVYQKNNEVLLPVILGEELTLVCEKKGAPTYVTDLQSVFAVISKTVTTGHQSKATVCIIPQCAGHQLDAVFSECSDNYLKCRPSQDLVYDSSDLSDKLKVYRVDINPITAKTTQISSFNTEEQYVSLLRHTMTLHVWWALGKVLEQGLDDNSVTQILKQTLLYDDDQMIVEHVLPHCTDSQTDLAVTQLVGAGQWESVAKLVQLVGDRKQTWTLGEPSVDTTLLHLVAGGRWKEVGDILQRGVDDAQFRWATDTALFHADDHTFAEHILSHIVNCGGQEIDSISAKVVAMGKQKSLEKILQLEKINTWAVDKISIDRESLVAEGNWREVGIILKQGVSDSLHRWLTQTASSRASSTDFIKYILPHCAEGQIDSVLITLVERRLWRSVAEVLKCGVGDCFKQWAVLKACKLYDDNDDVNDCVDGDDDGDDDGDVPRAGITCMYRYDDDDYVFNDGDYDDDDIDPDFFFNDDYYDDEDGARIQVVANKTLCDITLHCADNQLDCVLETLVQRGLWGAVKELFKRGVSDYQRLAAGDRSCKLYKDMLIVRYVLFDCCFDHLDWVPDLDAMVCWAQKATAIKSKDHLDSVLKTLVDGGKWRAVEKLFKQGVGENLKQWAVQKTCMHCSDICISSTVLRQCADDKLVFVLTTLVTKGKWQTVSEVLERAVCDSAKQWAVKEACAHFDGYHNCILQSIVSHCAEDQLDNVLTTLVERCLWQNVAELLDRGASDPVKQWAVKETCERCDGSQDNSIVIRSILSHCSDDQLDSVITTLVERALWWAVPTLLERDVTDYVKQWVILVACIECTTELYQDHDDVDLPLNCDMYKNEVHFILGKILPLCVDDQLDYVLKILVERRAWQSVAKVLKRSVSDSPKQWAVVEACKYYGKRIPVNIADDTGGSSFLPENANHQHDDQFIVENILPHCVDDQLDPVLTILVTRRLWKAVGHILKRVAGDFKTQWNEHKICGHCTLAEVYFSDSCVAPVRSAMGRKHALHCADSSPDPLPPETTSRDVCISRRNVSGGEVCDAQRRANIKTAFQHADQSSLINMIVPVYVYDSVQSALKMMGSKQFWSVFLVLLHYCTIDTLYMWAVAKDTEAKDKVFLDMIRNPCDGVKELTPAMWRSVTWSGLQRSLEQLLDWNSPLCEVLYESLLAIVREIWLSGCEKEIDIQKRTEQEALSAVEGIHQQILTLLTECKTGCVSDLVPLINSLLHQYAKSESKKGRFFQLYFIKCLVQQYYKRRAWEQMTNTILVVLTTVPLVADLQVVTLRLMLRLKRWDVIRHACLSGVCEHIRRQLFQAAVKQRQWSAVKRWADHTLYDDQRGWALGEARQEKRWDVYLQLAENGLSEWERVGVLFRVTMHADWNLVCEMLRTVADVTDMIELLHNSTGALSKLGAKIYEQRMNKLNSFEKNLSKATSKLKTMKTMVTRGKWWVVLHNVRHKPNPQHARRALKAAVSSEAWHAVMQLARLETDVTRRDSLFRDMVRLRQWPVCRALLEQGVSHELCLELLSEFTTHSQWTLVARVMECPMDDERRTKIMYEALLKKEGSVVWQCVNRMQTRLSVGDREDVFRLAFNREVWQAVKPLIEEQDVTGIRHRDTALLEAIEQHQWDVVDHCQRHHADINMKDDDGHTLIHRAARKKDWEAVEELTVRGGDPNLMDSEGLSVLHRAIIAEQWDVAKLLIQYHGDIHLAAQYNDDTGSNDYEIRTPLHMLIDARQGEVIESTLMWCPDQCKGVNGEKETALHAVCLSGWPGTLYHLVARKVDPLAVTKRQLTALCYAVLCKDCPQRMVAECIKMGFSANQPRVTDTAQLDWFLRLGVEEKRCFMSPLTLAVLRGFPVVTQLLYESGACSNSQLFELNTYLPQLIDPVSPIRSEYIFIFNFLWTTIHKCTCVFDYSFDTVLIKESVDYLRQVCRSPRSLVSTCRLVISRCLTLSKTRHGDIAYLPLSPMMKNYLMFSDLTDPRYPDLSC